MSRPARYPQYLPYPQPVRQGWMPVPNRSAVDFPQAQFAAPWLPPGSASVSPYRYPDNPVLAPMYDNIHDGDLGCLGCGDYGEPADFIESTTGLTSKCVIIPTVAFFIGILVGKRLQR